MVSTAERCDEKSWGRKNHKKCPETQSVRAQIDLTIRYDGFNLNEFVAERGLFGGFDGQDLATVVGAAAWAGDVSWFGSSTIAAGRELGRTPPVRELAEFLLHFGFAALWNGHGVIRLAVAAGIFRGWSGDLKF